MAPNTRSALYTLTGTAITTIEETTFAAIGVRERGDLQRLLRDNISILAPDTLVIAEEFGSWEGSQRRIDLLGLDREANLVVVELKRDQDGGHMELQALRYAAMVARMTFQDALDVYARHLSARREGNPRPDTAQAELLNFLGWTDPVPERFARDVRVILAAADFSREVTTTALWLRDRDIDIRCVRLRPYQHEGTLLLQVEQIVPLPEAEDYLVGIKAKAREERESATDAALDRTQYMMCSPSGETGPFTKRRLVFEIVRHLVAAGATPDMLQTTVSSTGLWATLSGVLEGDALRDAIAKLRPGDSKAAKRYFTKPGEPFVIDGKTYDLSNQWGVGNFGRALDAMLALFPRAGITYGEVEESSENRDRLSAQTPTATSRRIGD
jgi:hypothetical protein